MESITLKLRRVSRVIFDLLKPGMVAARDIYTREGTLLLARGFTLDAGLLRQFATVYDMGLIAVNSLSSKMCDDAPGTPPIDGVTVPGDGGMRSAII